MNIKIVMIIVFLVFGAAVVLANEFLFDFGTSFMLSNEFLFGSMTDDKPNIIVIMTDDLDVNTLDTMLSKNWMPNLQKFIIENGTEFTNSFVTNSECCPSRSTFLTGQYSHNHGVLLNPLVTKLDDSHTLATWLDNAGYRTALVGKYLNHYGQYIDASYIPPGWDSWQALTDPYTYRMYDYQLNNNGNLMKFGNHSSDYQTDVIAEFSSNFISESEIIDDDVPFFLYIATVSPHAETVVTKRCTLHSFPIGIIRGPERYRGTAELELLPQYPSFNETDVSDKPIWIQEFPQINEEGLQCIEMIYQNRIESLRAVDDLIGTVIETLKDYDEFDKTVIIFTSDNGFLLGEHKEWSKFAPYEESIRVPLYISTPGYPFLQSSSKLVINNDLAPTFLEFAGARADISVDGRSLVPLLSNPNEKNWRSSFLVEHWKPEGFKPLEFLPTFKGIRTNSHLYVEYEDSSREFYDLLNDPYQLDNQYDCTDLKCKKQIEILQDLLSDLKNCDNGKCQVVENR